MVTPGGFPDSGCGFYADKLSYKEWYELNNVLRVHSNFIENIPVIVFILAVGGIYFPLIALIVGAVNVISRPVYIQGYLKHGSIGRLNGAYLGGIPLGGLALITLLNIAWNTIN